MLIKHTLGYGRCFGTQPSTWKPNAKVEFALNTGSPITMLNPSM